MATKRILHALGDYFALERGRLNIVVPGEIQQAASEVSVQNSARELTKSRRLLSERLAESTDIQFKIIRHARPSKDVARSNFVHDIHTSNPIAT